MSAQRPALLEAYVDANVAPIPPHLSLEQTKNFLSSNPEIMVEISDRVLVAAGLKPGDEEPLVDNGFAEADEEPIEVD